MASIIQSTNANPTTSSITLTFTTNNVNQYYYFIYYYLTADSNTSNYVYNSSSTSLDTSSNTIPSFSVMSSNWNTSTTKDIPFNALITNTSYTFQLYHYTSNTVPTSPILDNTVVISTLSSGSSGGDPHIVTIYGEKYDLAHNDGLYVLYDNKNNDEHFKVICECLHLTDKEIDNAPFNNRLLIDTTYMTKIWIHFNNNIIELNLNTLKYKSDTKLNNIINFSEIYDDKYVLKKHYSDRKIKQCNIRFNGKSRDINIKLNTLNYHIKASVDLNCADHRNDVIISGNDMSGFGAIISSKHNSLLFEY